MDLMEVCEFLFEQLKPLSHSHRLIQFWTLSTKLFNLYTSFSEIKQIIPLA